MFSAGEHRTFSLDELPERFSINEGEEAALMIDSPDGIKDNYQVQDIRIDE